MTKTIDKKSHHSPTFAVAVFAPSGCHVQSERELGVMLHQAMKIIFLSVFISLPLLTVPSVGMAAGVGSCGSGWFYSLAVPDILCFDTVGGQLWYKSCSQIAKALKVNYIEINFSPRCNQHDNCYDSSAKKSTCDAQFRANLYTTCQSRLASWPKALDACNKDANLAYSKVQGNSGKACDAYKNAKVKHKTCD